MADIFDTIAPEQSTPSGDIFDKLAPTQSHGSLLDSIATTLSRPGAALRNSLMTDVKNFQGKKPIGKDSASAFMQGFQNPAKVPSLASVLPAVPTDNPFLSGAESNASAVIGAAGDILIDPLMLGIPGLGIAGRAIGGAVEKFAPGAAQWLARETKNINPAWNARVNPSTGIQDILRKIDTEPTPNPSTQVQGDVTPVTPAAQVPVDLPNAQGQLGLRGFQNTPRNALMPPELAPEPLGPIRDQGQQEFDFTQGPQEPAAPVVMPQDNAIQLSAQTQKEIDGIARMPDGARPTPYRGLSKPQIQDLFIQRIANKPVIKTELPPEFNVAQPVMKSLKGGTGHADPFEFAATDEERAHREQLLADRDSVDALVKKEEATQDPSTLADIKTILTDIHPKVKDPNIIEMGAGAKPPDFELGPEGQAALDRIKAKIVANMQATGKSAVDVIKEMHPELSNLEVKAVSDAMKIGNLNLKQYPDEQKQQLTGLFAGQENRLTTKPMTSEQITEKANNLTTLPVTETIGRSGEGQLAAEQRRMVMNDIAKMKAIAEDPKLSAQETVQKILQSGTEKTKKVKTEVGRALGSMNAPLEAQQESLDAMRKIVDRIRQDPTLKSSETKALINSLKGQFPELKNVTTAELFKEWFRNAITSSPITWGINATSNYGNVAARPVMRTLEVSAAKIRSLMSGNPSSVTYKEIGAMLKGMKDALGGAQLPESLKSKTFSDKYNVSALDTLSASAKTDVGKNVLSGISKVVNVPATVMRNADEHAKNIMGMMEMYASKARGEDVLNDQRAIERITGAQARGSFQDEMSSIGKWVAQSRNYFSHQPPTVLNQAGDILTYAIQPFIQTVDRIIAKGLNTSILGTGTSAFKAATGKYTGALAKGIAHDPVAAEKMDRDMAAIMISAPLFIWTGMQLAQGNITGAAPGDTAGQQAFANTGKQEYSVKMGNRWVQLRYLPEPMATAMQINLALIQGMAEAKDKGQGLGSGVFNAVTKMGYMLGTKQYLGGMNSLVSAVAGKDNSDVSDPTDVTNAPNRNPLVKKIVPATVVPSIVKDVGVVKDTLENKPRVVADTAMEATKRRAGLTSGMVPELNTFGEPVTHPMMGRVNNDPAYSLAEKFPPQPVERTVEGVRLSQQEYHDLKQNVGQQRKAVYSALANNSKFMNAPEGVQQMLVEQMISTADSIGSEPEKVRELKSDPVYYDRELRTLLQVKKPGGERHFPYLK